MCSDELHIDIPGTPHSIYQGDIVRLGRFELDEWVVCYGWFSWGGNRPWCGWYLMKTNDPDIIKPLQLPDLDDIYVIKH